MPSFVRMIGLATILIAVLGLSAMAGKREVVEKTFDATESVRISTVSGDCLIKQGDDDKIHVHLVYTYSPQGSFEPEFEERNRVLRLSENHYESNSGNSLWTVTVPAETRVRFSTASGDFEADGLQAEVNVETASGDISLTNCSGHFDMESASGSIMASECNGELEFNTASGDIEVENCKGQYQLQSASGDVQIDDCEGEFVVGTASGDIEAVGLTLKEDGSFETASGHAEVALAASAEHDLVVSSASGSATLDFNGNPITGEIEMIARLRRGRIVAPFGFDNEEEFERWGQDYIRKTVTKGSNSPLIAIETASGRATLIE